MTSQMDSDFQSGASSMDGKKKTKTTFCYYNVSVGFNPNRSLQLVGKKILSAN
jgi:hypothetical protein